MRRTAFVYSMGLLLGVTASLNAREGQRAATTHSAGQPTSRPANAEGLSRRKIDVTLLGRVSDIRGIDWPTDARGKQRSLNVTEPCELTVHLPGGRALKINTRPILVVTREGDVVVSISAPPEASPGQLPDKAREMEKLIDAWGATPPERMRESIGLLKKMAPSPTDGVIYGGIERIGFAALDQQSELQFSLYIAKGGIATLNAHISARNEDWTRVAREEDARKAATKPSSK